MFGIGGSEIIVILIVALLFLGPDKLPDAAKQLSKGIRDLKRGSREIQQTIENDETIGGAIRDLKSALRGEDLPPARMKPRPVKKPPPVELEGAAAVPLLGAAIAGTPAPVELPVPDSQMQLDLGVAPAAVLAEASLAAADALADAPLAPVVRLPPDVGERDPDMREGETDREELAAMIKPASGTIAKGALPTVAPLPSVPPLTAPAAPAVAAAAAAPAVEATPTEPKRG